MAEKMGEADKIRGLLQRWLDESKVLSFLSEPDTEAIDMGPYITVITRQRHERLLQIEQDYEDLCDGI